MPDDALSLFREAVRRAADKPAVVYFDRRLTYRDVDAMSDAALQGNASSAQASEVGGLAGVYARRGREIAGA